jgi:hypothetical protein
MFQAGSIVLLGGEVGEDRGCVSHARRFSRKWPESPDSIAVQPPKMSDLP